MEFWGVEVKSGQSLHVDPGEDMLVHISQVALAENKKNENETIRLFLKVGEQKLIIGTLSHDKIPQLATEIVLEKGFELSHSWRNGSVFFTGYKVDASDPEDDAMNNDDPAVAREKQPAAAKQVNFKLPNEDAKDESDDESDTESSDDDSEEESEDEEEKKVTAEVGKDEDDDEDDSSDSDEEEDDDSSDDENTPKKAEVSKKRPSAEANTSKSSTSNKKAKFLTPEKTETKKPHVHVATPYPTKGKNSGSNGEASKQTPKSGGSFGCKSCNRSFGSEMGLQSHTKAKHSAAA